MSKIKRIKFLMSFAKNGRQWQQGEIATVPDDLSERQAERAIRRKQATDITDKPSVTADGPKRKTTTKTVQKTKAEVISTTDAAAKPGGSSD